MAYERLPQADHPAEVRPAYIRLSELGASEVGAGTGQVGVGEVRLEQVRLGQIGPAQVGADKGRPHDPYGLVPRVGPDVRAAQRGVHQLRVLEAPDDPGSSQIGAAEIRLLHDRGEQARALRARPSHSARSSTRYHPWTRLAHAGQCSAQVNRGV